MRRSTVVTLTILPVLAAAAVARADPPPLPPDAPAPLQEPELRPPGMTEQVLMPPGMTPPVDCDDDPAWDVRPECQPSYGSYIWNGRVIRGGFGHYFWVAGG